MCCKRCHILFPKFSLKFNCKICVQKEVIRNFQNHILVTWPATNLLILWQWCRFQITFILFRIWPTNHFLKAKSYNFHFHKNDVTWPIMAYPQKKKINSRILESGWRYVGQNHLAQWNKPSIMKSSISSVPILSSLQRSSKLTSDVDSPSDMNVKTRILCTLFSWDKPGKKIKDLDVPLSYFATYYKYIKWFTIISPPNHLAINEIATKKSADSWPNFFKSLFRVQQRK